MEETSVPTELTLRITGMDCASCAQTLEAGVGSLAGVEQCQVSFATETLTVQGEVARDEVVRRVQELGYEVELEARIPEGEGPANSIRGRGLWAYLWSRRDARAALLATLLVLPGLIFEELLPWWGVQHFLMEAGAVAAMLIAGYPIFRSAWRSLRLSRQISINVLMSIAAIGALFIGAYTEAAVVMILFVIGEAIEGYAADQARDSVRGLMELAPREAIRLRRAANGTRQERVRIEQIRPGDRILVKPGERIAMDGIVVAGATAVNQAPITGESRLVEKAGGDEVFAGSINGEGAIEVEVTRLAEDNTIARVIKMVAEAQEKRAPVQRFVDRFAGYYTPVVVVLALLVAILPPLLLGQPFIAPGHPTQGLLYRALALLVIACPCALVISTPVSLISAISNGARHGVLFKGGVYLETLSRVRAIAFDKTGTLTLGRPTVVNVRAVDCTDPDTGICPACEDLLALATSVEKGSEHPLATAIVQKAAEQGLVHTYPAADGVKALVGRGVQGSVAGEAVTIASHAYFDDNIRHPQEHCDEAHETTRRGHTTMMIARGSDYRGFIAVADVIREESREAVAQLRRLGIEHLVMLTGDDEETARQVAAEAGLTEVQANCLPADKVDAVQELVAKHGQVAMVGDGINDAPALAQATVGIALGTTAQALETADITLMRDSLAAVPYAVELSRRTMRTVYVNVAASLLIKFLFFVLVLAGAGTMWMAVLADMGTSLLVTLNGMRLLYQPRLQTQGVSS
ncbi:MAG: cation-translocating P-type ATPase [Caldilineae bacterium]|nr:MAG: cation-translocating P-type ATPase [Caldilineae bacterium]